MKLHRQKRQGHTFSRILVGVVAAVGIIGFILIGGPKEMKSNRWTVVVATNPATVISWDRMNGRFTVISIPTDIVTEGVYGYGRYSIEALWKLGIIDRQHHGLLLQESLADMLGVPIQWYIGPTGEELPDAAGDPLSLVRSGFSMPQTLRHIVGGRRTNMLLSNYIAFSWAITTARPDKFDVFTLLAGTIATSEQLPDGTTRHVVDRERLDHVIGDAFEDDQVRKEAIPVAVLNTTTVPALGNRAARMLTRLGVNVVMVANDDEVVGECVIHGSKSALSSFSSLLIRTVLHCRAEEVKEDYPVELVVRVGKHYQEMFVSP